VGNLELVKHLKYHSLLADTYYIEKTGRANIENFQSKEVGLPSGFFYLNPFPIER